jgi:hypothetical protein
MGQPRNQRFGDKAKDEQELHPSSNLSCLETGATVASRAFLQVPSPSCRGFLGHKPTREGFVAPASFARLSR